MQPPNDNQSQLAKLVNRFDRETKTEYRDERYTVRDNGAVYRLNRYRRRARPLDKRWTFGRQSKSTGYLHISAVPVHRIVCCAFHGLPPTEAHVVDHIDTNRANNRPENLRWVTRLENILLNPITLRRIELSYGSIENFFADPSKVINSSKLSNINWMTTVSKEEAQLARERLQCWAEGSSIPVGGELGSWLYSVAERPQFRPETEEYESLTNSVIQVGWRTPTEFPNCPAEVGQKALRVYSGNLTFGSVFAQNSYGRSFVVDSSIDDSELIVLSHIKDGVKQWGVTRISVANDFFYHKSELTFFSLTGAVKQLADLSGEEHGIGDCIDDFC